MKGDDARDLELQTLRDRLSRLSDASLRINESLDFDTVLHEVLDSARELTGARYAVITLLNDAGEIQDSLPSGLSSEEAEHLWEPPTGSGRSSTTCGGFKSRCECGISSPT